MALPRRTPAALPSLSMESSSMAPNHVAKAPHESDAGARWHGLVLATFSGGPGLTIMLPMFVRKKQQPT
jgi:hypothetical protein